jgi:hypothetical protein
MKFNDFLVSYKIGVHYLIGFEIKAQLDENLEYIDLFFIFD